MNTNFVAHRLGEFGFAGHVSAEEIPQVTAELNASPAFRDENITAVTHRVHNEAAGHIDTVSSLAFWCPKSLR